MKTIRNIGALALLVVAVGCGNTPQAKNPSTDKVPPTTTAQTKTDEVVLPDSLKNAAWAYMGLGETRMLTYTAKFSKGSLASDGTQTTELKSVKDGVATYTIDRTGGLAEMGMDTVELSDKGASTTASSRGQIEESSLEVPGDLAVGSKWESKTTLTVGSVKTSLVTENEATKEEKITVAAGTFDCIVVESTATGDTTGSQTKSDNGKSKSTMTAYYAKGVGLVKLTGKGKKANGDPAEFSMELKKIG